MSMRQLRNAACCVLVVAACTTADAGESCSCDRIVAVEAEVAELRSTVAALVRQQPKVGELDSARMEPRAVRHEVDPLSVSVPEPAARQLQITSGGKTYTATRSWHLHEFPSGHTCNAPGKAYLKPNMAAEGMTELDYPTSGTTTSFSLISNVDGQARQEIQQIAVPLKVVHDASCSSAPSLVLQGNTQVAGSLTVAGVDVAQALQAASSLVWTPLTSYLETGMTEHTAPASNFGGPAEYAVRGGLVYLRGRVETSDGSSFTTDNAGANTFLMTLPSQLIPTRSQMFITAGWSSAGSASTRFLRVGVKATGASNAGKIQVYSANSNTVCYLDNIIYSLG